MFTIIDKQYKIYSHKQVFSEPNINMEADKIIKSKNINVGGNIKKKTMPEQENQIDRLNEELITIKEYLRSVLKERDAAKEEYRAALEDLQSVNEELLSMNEELESAKQELYFANQNLNALNKTLRGGNKELNMLNNDLKILLSNIHVPVIMLNNDLRIKHFTPDVGKVLHIIKDDIGRPLSDLKMKFGINDLDKILHEVMDTLKTQVINIQLSDNHWYRIKIGPYKTPDYKIGGAILTFHDILYGDKFGIHSEIN
jgi:two-component system CheB/CheR fusion protein